MRVDRSKALLLAVVCQGVEEYDALIVYTNDGPGVCAPGRAIWCCNSVGRFSRTALPETTSISSTTKLLRALEARSEAHVREWVESPCCVAVDGTGCP